MKNPFTYFQTTGIGLSETIGVNERHGLVHYLGNDDHQETISFRVTEPFVLENPSPFTIKDLIEQIAKMKLIPISIEVFMYGQHRVYFTRDYYPDVAHQYGFST